MELLPCPFCGGEAHLVQPHDNSRPYVMCITSYCTSPKMDDAKAIAAWNRRTPAPEEKKDE